MVGVVIDCRLGNQLFQYAFIKALSKRLDTPFFLNENIEIFKVTEYFDIEGYNSFKNTINRLYFKIAYGSLLKSTQSQNIEACNDEDYLTLKNNVIYRGYFQSEFFFQGYIHSVKSSLSIKSKYRQDFDMRYGYIFDNNQVIAVHIRRGDYLNLNNWWIENLGSSDLSLPVSYYEQCIREINTRKDAKIIFVSDDIAFAKSAFGHLKNAIFSHENFIIDFQIIMNADACIISNSSFAWWAAYLNEKTYKKVYCPQFWLGTIIEKEYPRRIIPPDWIQVKVNCSDSRVAYSQ